MIIKSYFYYPQNFVSFLGCGVIGNTNGSDPFISGSSPDISVLALWSSGLRHRPFKPEMAGSIPPGVIWFYIGTFIHFRGYSVKAAHWILTPKESVRFGLSLFGKDLLQTGNKYCYNLLSAEKICYPQQKSFYIH